MGAISKYQQVRYRSLPAVGGITRGLLLGFDRAVSGPWRMTIRWRMKPSFNAREEFYIMNASGEQTRLSTPVTSITLSIRPLLESWNHRESRFALLHITTAARMNQQTFPGDREPDAVQVQKTPDGITYVMIHRPRVRNAVDHITGKKLVDAFLDFENDPKQKVCIFHGDNGTFCAGYDIHQIAKRHQKGAHFDGPYNLAERVQGRNLGPMGPSRMHLHKPLICAVAGWAIEGGLELSLMADMRVVEETTVFGIFGRRFGLPLIDGGCVRLPAIVGLGRALDMILTGRAVGAKEALQIGLANRVVPKGQALEEATKIAQQLVQFPQAVMNADRADTYYAAYDARSFEDAMAREFDEGTRNFDSESIPGAARFSSGRGRHGSFEKL